jgi:hypothetical protein
LATHSIALWSNIQKGTGALIVPANGLPSSCQLVTEIKTAPIFPATTNPFVTDNDQLIEFVLLIGFGNKPPQDVSVAISVLYVEGEQDEVGIGVLDSSPRKPLRLGTKS